MKFRVFSLIVAILLLFNCNQTGNPIAPGSGPASKDDYTTTIAVREPCLQIGFGHYESAELLRSVADLGWKVARMDNQRTSVQDTINQMREFEAAGLKPYVIVRDAEQLAQLPSGYDYELRNEPDLEGPSPDEYKKLMWDAAHVARSNGQRLFVGTISNLNKRGFDYLNAILPLPEWVGFAAHRYGDGSFDKPHAPYHSREGEVRGLRSIIGNRPLIVSEFGYPTRTKQDKWGFVALGLSDKESVYRIKQEYLFWEQQGAVFSCLYQLNDGHTQNEQFGIRGNDGTWKESAYIFREKQ